MDGDESKEIDLLSKVNHSNVIRLFGVSLNEEYCYLVYEYAATGNLSDWIYINGKFELHTEYRLHRMWPQHLTIYTVSLLLLLSTKISSVITFFWISGFRAKIANFGLARFVKGEGDNYVMTRHIVGQEVTWLLSIWKMV